MANRKIKGTVTKASKSKYGYFLQLDGEPAYYNTKYRPKCGEGDVVGLEYGPKSNGKPGGQIFKVKIFEDNSGGYDGANSEGGRPAPSGGGGGSRQSAGGGGDQRDSIVWQHSQEMAIRAAALVLENGGLAIPAKAKADEKMTLVANLIDGLTVNYFRDAIDPRNCAAFKDAEEVEEDTEWETGDAPESDPEPDPDDWDDWEE